MCTNQELKSKIAIYCNVQQELKKLEDLKKELSREIISEMEIRKTDTFEDVKIISERLTETATAAGKQELKKLFSSDIDKYISISYSKYLNTRALKKIQ